MGMENLKPMGFSAGLIWDLSVIAPFGPVPIFAGSCRK
jgi:hypothetical protein